MTRRLFLPLPLLFLSACLIETGYNKSGLAHEEDRCYFNRDPRTGKRIKWNEEDFPITFYIHSSVPKTAYQNYIAAADHWNMRWMEHTEEKGIESGPLVEVIKGEKFNVAGSPIKDDWNMLIFANRETVGEIMGNQSFEIDEIQAVTYSRKQRSLLGEISIKSADILVNKDSFDYYYDEDYTEDIIAYKAARAPERRIAFTLSGAASLKQRFLSWLKKIFSLFKKKGEGRGLAGIRKSIPSDMVDFPSLAIHEIGHAVPGLAHVNEDEYRTAHVSPHRMAPRRNRRRGRGGGGALREGDWRAVNGPERLLAAFDEDYDNEEEGGARSGKDQSVMKVELLKGEVRRYISDFDLENIFCGYYGNDE